MHIAIEAAAGYRTLAPHPPERFREMERLFLSVICGSNAGRFREALHEVYIPRIQRGKACFAANVLGATGPLLSAFSSFLRTSDRIYFRGWAQRVR